MAIIVCLTFMGCDSENTKTPSEAPTAEPTAEPTPEPLPKLTAEDKNDRLVLPFWRLDTMYDECGVFIKRDDGRITAKLLFTPTKLISVTDYSLKNEYTEGVDYTWDGASNELVLTENSSIPYFTQENLKGYDDNGKAYSTNISFVTGEEKFRIGGALYCVGKYLYEKQVAVTYEYEYGSYDGPVTEYQGDRLPKTIAKMKAGEKLTICWYGDSVFEGCDASGFRDRAPNMASFPTLVPKYLKSYYDCTFKNNNKSQGGEDTAYAVKNMKTVTAGSAAPDLVIIGWGMNGNLTGEENAANVQKIIEYVRSVNPDCEFLLVSCVNPNPDSGMKIYQEQVAAEYEKLAGEGVGFVNMLSVQDYILETKDFISISGNNINHPNDWFIRIHAMHILSALIDW